MKDRPRTHFGFTLVFLSRSLAPRCAINNRRAYYFSLPRISAVSARIQGSDSFSHIRRRMDLVRRRYVGHAFAAFGSGISRSHHRRGDGDGGGDGGGGGGKAGIHTDHVRDPPERGQGGGNGVGTNEVSGFTFRPRQREPIYAVTNNINWLPARACSTNPDCET